MIREVKKSCGIFIASKLRRAILLIYVSMSEPFQQEKKKKNLNAKCKNETKQIRTKRDKAVDPNLFTPIHGGRPV